MRNKITGHDNEILFNPLREMSQQGASTSIDVCCLIVRLEVDTKGRKRGGIGMEEMRDCIAMRSWANKKYVYKKVSK